VTEPAATPSVYESGLYGRYIEVTAGGGSTMHRRTVLGIVAAGFGSLLAGCSGSTVAGEVVANETPLGLTHEYEIQGTPSGTRLVVTVTAENGGEEQITPDGRVPELSCTFLNDAGEPLHDSGLQPVEAISAGETATFEFQLGTRVSEASRYELAAAWTRD
jgi:hypothetical protein